MKSLLQVVVCLHGVYYCFISPEEALNVSKLSAYYCLRAGFLVLLLLSTWYDS